MPRLLNLTGETYGKLTIIELADSRNGRIAWNCQCKCGKKTIVTTQLLRSKKTTSCGCTHKDQLINRNKKHGLIMGGKTRLYKLYIRIRERCNSPNCKSFKYYGARGIKLEEDLNSFDRFYTWAVKNGYKDHLTIERIDVDKGYTATNCTWIPIQDQTRNKRNSIWTPDTVSIARSLKLYTALTNKQIAKMLDVAPHNITALSNTWLDIGPLPI